MKPSWAPDNSPRNNQKKILLSVGPCLAQTPCHHHECPLLSADSKQTWREKRKEKELKVYERKKENGEKWRKKEGK